MKILKELLFITLLLVFVIGIHSTVQADEIVPPPEDAITLYDLAFDGIPYITAGDKKFDSWTVNTTYDVNVYEVAQSIAENITVTPLPDGGLDPGPGLRYDVYSEALSIFYPNEFTSIFFEFSFRVSTLNDLLIKDNSLLYPPGGAWMGYTPGEYGAYGTGSAIGETVNNTPGFDSPLGHKRIAFNIDVGGVEDITYSSVSFSPTNEIWVTTDIYVWASLENQLAAINNFEQRFSQTPVPEPATMLLTWYRPCRCCRCSQEKEEKSGLIRLLRLPLIA